jgi:hypothetical protein
VNPFELAFAIVALVLVFKLVKMAMHKNALRQDDHVDAALVERLNQVEERVRVLERIVTDERLELKRQFKDLES